MRADYDIIAIGGGAAGLVTAAGGAGLGARTALVERHRMGGECLWTGCVPSKALLASARAAADARDAARYGVDADVRVDFARVMQHVRSAQATIEPNDSPERFRGLGVDVLHGTARFVGERTLRIDERTITGRHIVIATGSRPAIPPIPGLDQVRYHTNETIFEIDELPESLAVLGGGPIGVELAQAFALLGSKVTLIESADRILATEDEDLVAILSAELRAAGVDLQLGTKVEQVAYSDDAFHLRIPGREVSVAQLLVAAGRQSALDTLDLSAGNVAFEGNSLTLDRNLRTSAKNVWAAGDVTGAPRFTHVADYQARAVLRNALFPFTSAVNYDVVPTVIYSIPELARVGLTEAAARKRHGDGMRVLTREFKHVDRAIADARTIGAVKIISDAKGRLLGGHVLGYHASSMIAEITLAMRQKIPLSRIASTMHAYPTYPEALKHTADAYMRSRFTGAAKAAANWLVRRI